MNPMIRNIIISLSIIALALFAGNYLLETPLAPVAGEHAEAAAADYLRGPHNGRLLEQDGFALEITIFETGVPPEFRVYPYYQQQAIDPSGINLTIELGRTGNVKDQIDFSPQNDLLRGNAVVTEPHSFDVTVSAIYQNKTYQWQFASYEGRTIIPSALAQEAGIGTEQAGPATLIETLKLTGRVKVDPGRMSEVRARFPGLVKQIHVGIGDIVKAGETLLTIESNESLQDYTVKAPINGLIIKRNVEPGEITAELPLFTIMDLTRVWVELDVFARDVDNVRQGQTVTILTLDGYTASGTIDWLSPLSNHASQSIHVRIPLDNPDHKLRPGQFVRAEVSIATHDVPLAVKRSGVQGFRDFQVVFAKFGDTYEVRMLEFGISDSDWLEVTDGLAAGTEYVTENSYLIKADIEKSGASHDH